MVAIPDYDASPGLRVLVFSGDQEEDWGLGTIIDVEEGYPSRIELDNGRVTRGCECWWIPKKVAEELEHAYIRGKKNE